MDWLPTHVDIATISVWCILTGDLGRPVMTLAGFGGLIATIRSLYTLPAVGNISIITLRNKKRKYRRITFAVGIFAFILFSVSIVLYFRLTSFLRTIGKVCEMAEVPHDAAVAVLPFLLTTVSALVVFAWFQARILKLKSP
jgi:hypothetical protein